MTVTCAHSAHSAHSEGSHVVLPVISCQPSYREPVLLSVLTNKCRSPPDSAGSSATPADSPPESEKCCTPYRLPRISPRATPCPPGGAGGDSPVSQTLEADEKMWGRFGYEDHVRTPELGPSIHKARMNAASPFVPGTSICGARSFAKGAQRYRHDVMSLPTFRNAAIIPAVNVHVIRHVNDVHMYQSLLEKASRPDHHPINPAPTPTPASNSRSVSPAKSTRSIHWTLGSGTRYLLFDRRGQGSKQGPYSREFTVRCMAPNNWMRMKWGRQKGAMAH
ncbi:hypothetical protein ACOMHN_040220 [Nucella lapillus]